MIVTSENITSKQRSKLKSIAANLSPVTQIGKGGITDNLLKTLSDALDAHEIIKVNILETADDDARNLAENVADLLEAVPVMEEEFVLQVPEKYPLLPGTSVNLKDLSHETFLLDPTPAPASVFVRSLFEKAGFNPKISVSSRFSNKCLKTRKTAYI